MKTNLRSIKDKGLLISILLLVNLVLAQDEFKNDSVIGSMDSVNSKIFYRGCIPTTQICKPVFFPPIDTTSTTLNVSFEYRPRVELRNGFRQLRNDSSSSAIFASHRARLNFAFKKKRFAGAFSLQDVRTFGAADPKSTAGTVQVFEAWVEPSFNDYFSVRIGKQKFILDNSRLFAQNDWRNNGGTHDAAKLMYKKNNVETQLLFAWNQSVEANYFTSFAPIGFNNYKSLLVSYFQLKSKNEKFIFSSTNYYEGFQYGSNSGHQNFRYTNGGRLNYHNNKLNLYGAGYVQWGHNNVGKRLSAFYAQVEANYSAYINIQLGAEFKSGNSSSSFSYDNAFQYPYGVAHSFNGTMEYFASSFPGSLNDFGLINPYFSMSKIIKHKILLSLKNHLFYSQYLAYDKVNKINAPSTYLGFESDFNLSYYPNGYTKVDLGVSALKATKSMEFINAGSSSYLSYWTYLQATFTPQLFSSKK